MTRVHIPETVLTAAHDRARARAARDWDLADRLRGEIEAAGWTIVDRGTDFALSPAAPPDVDEGARVRYGASRNVPSRFEEPAVGLATVVLVATDWPADLERAVAGLRASCAGRNLGGDRGRRALRGAGDGAWSRSSRPGRAPTSRSSSCGPRSGSGMPRRRTSGSAGWRRPSSSCSTPASSRPATS